ncbi:MAG: uroporphyrinogen-III C-methyltransferase [Pseudomonadales bacterium]
MANQDRATENQSANEPEEGREEGSPTIETEHQSAPFNFVSTLLALVALGVASYAAFMIHTSLSGDVDSELRGVKGRLAEVELRFDRELQQVASVRSQLDKVTAELAQLDTTEPVTLASFETFKAQVDDRLADIRDRIGTGSQDWLLAEVEYLLRLGAQRVIMEGDAKGAAALFRAADEIIRDTEGIAAFDLRKALALDIAALDAVADVDVDGIYVRLNALASQVTRLSQKQQKFESAPPEPVAIPDADMGYTTRLLTLLESAGERLATLVDYRAADESITPILPPKEEYYLRQNLVLKLQMAQLGLLRADQVVFYNSLTEAQSWIVQYFDADDPATTAMLVALTELEGINVEKERPDVTQSLREVRALLRNFHQSAPRGGDTQ